MRQHLLFAFAIVISNACATTGVPRVANEMALPRSNNVTEDSLVQLWREASLDTNALSSLADFTGQFGAVGANALMMVISDSAPARKKLFALWSLTGYWGDWIPECNPFPWGNGWRPTGFPSCPRNRDDDESLPPTSSITTKLAGALRQSLITAATRDSVYDFIVDRSSQLDGTGEAARQWLAWRRLERSDAQARRLCQQLAQSSEVVLDFPVAAISWAEAGLLARCDLSGPLILERLWTRPSNDTGAMHALMLGTTALHHDRVRDILFRTARDEGRQLHDRRAAVAALGAFVHPGFATIAVDIARRKRESAESCAPPAWNSYLFPQTGGRSASSSIAARAFQNLRSIAADAQDVSVSQLASQTMRCALQLRDEFPTDAPLPSLSVSGYQTPAVAPQLTNEDLADIACESQRDSLFDDRDGQRVMNAIYELAYRCPEAAGRMVAERWRAPPPDSSDAMRMLQGRSTQFFDRRIFEVMLERFADERLSTLSRANALAILYAYTTYTPVALQQVPGRTTTLVIEPVMRNHWIPSFGGQLVTNAREQILAAIDVQLNRGSGAPEFLALLQRTQQMIGRREH